MGESNSWTTIAESRYPWEREALEFIRERLPAHEPYRAWSNFEFLADDGSVNEVDLLVFTPQGLFLVEIKSRPGRLSGDSGTWTWQSADGRRTTTDNPLIAANAKARKLRALLSRQRVCKSKGKPPFIEALVFVSATDLQYELGGVAALRICLRDRPAEGDSPAAPGIMAALTSRACPGLSPEPKGRHDRPTARLVGQALEQAGVRPSRRHRKVGDYVLERVLAEGPGYQDWEATHVQLTEIKRRVRLYLVRSEASEEDRQIIRRAALREFQFAETLQHPGILRAHGFTEHELGPALIFEHDPASVRLDHYLAERKDSLDADARLKLVRQIAEIVRFAHEKKAVHRSLSPRSILVADPGGPDPRVKIFNWQAGYRGGPSASGISREIAATCHVDRLVDQASTAYMAPEAVSDEGAFGEHLDVFSLGALAYHIFSDEPPAADGIELGNRLRQTRGLKISSVLNGAGANLDDLIQFSTHPNVADRTESAADFLDRLDQVKDELTAPEQHCVEDPSRAQKGDLLPGGFTVIKWLGQGACSVGLFVERGGRQYILKVASQPEYNARLADEAEVLQKLRHQHIVELAETVEIGDRAAFLMRPVLVGAEEKRVETLGHRRRKEGRLHVDLLQRFGEDLLGVVNYLEEQGIRHRDIKPDNIAVGQVGRGDKLHLVLFDFSLSRTPAENIHAGTKGYLDPLLSLRQPPGWDLHAERYAAGMTLHELATGTLPVWGDGQTDPAHLDCEITIDAEQFDANLRESFTAFFTRTFRRNPAERFDNAEQMLRQWTECFKGIDASGILTDHDDEETLGELLAGAALETPIAQLGLGTRAANALDRASILTVEDLLSVSPWRLQRMPGVGKKTCREMILAARILRQRLGTASSRAAAEAEETTGEAGGEIAGRPSIDHLARRVARAGSRDGPAARQALDALLGLDAAPDGPWPDQRDVERRLELAPGRIGQFAARFRARWAKEASLTQLRAEIAEILAAAGGAMPVEELAEAILASRGSAEEEPLRSRRALAAARAAAEVERTLAEPRFLVLRQGQRVLLAASVELAVYAVRLGDQADRLAAEDPLAPPNRAVERLREIEPPDGAEALSDARLLRLAASASLGAAVSSRQELYPRGMDAARALKLSPGALYGVDRLSVDQVRERVASRYPEAATLPGRPVLDDLLAAAGYHFRWDAVLEGGCYVAPMRETLSVTSASASVSRYPTASGHGPPGEITPEEADARQFEERLDRAIRDGSFLALLVHPKYYQRAAKEICRRYALEAVDFEGMLIEALREVADSARVNWDLVLKTDAAPNAGDWDKLLLLVGRAMAKVEASFFAGGEDSAAPLRSILLTYPGLLARYEHMGFLERLRDRAGRAPRLHACWLLLPGDQQAAIDGQPVPLLGPGQRARIPESWLQNVHRGAKSWEGKKE